MLVDYSKYKNMKITKADIVYDILKERYNALEPFEKDKEHLYAIGLTRRNTIRYIDQVSIGSLIGTVAEPREIFRMAIHQAVGGGIILAHNHPSGNLNPSEADIRLTRRVKNAGEIIDIRLMDHIIFTEDGFYSFANEGVI
jgi:DNA repair protein RadC